MVRISRTRPCFCPLGTTIGGPSSPNRSGCRFAGARFRINGRHDPPEREQLRLTFMELIRRDFLNKKLNLPSDTPIDLTLDTTWNANQIISDLLEYARRGETPVLTTDETP